MIGESVYVGSDLVSELTRTWGNPNWIHPMSETLNGITTTFTPGGLGEVGTMTTNGKTTTYTYQWGRVKSITGGEPNSVVDRMINPDGTIASETVAGRTTQYAYDSLGRLTTITPPGGGTLTTINYADPFHVVTTRGRRSSTTDYDPFGRAIRTVDNSGVETRTEYDPEGRVIAQSAPYTPGATTGNQLLWTHTEYDLLGRAFKRVSRIPMPARRVSSARRRRSRWAAR